jgi:hypothetical protein
MCATSVIFMDILKIQSSNLFHAGAVSRNEVAHGIHIEACCQHIHLNLVAVCLVTFIPYNLMYSVHFKIKQ